jgi:hypothetical protein
MRARLKDETYIQSVPYTLVIVATVLAYLPLLLYFQFGVNGYFVLAVFTGSFYFFCIRTHLAYLKRHLFSPEERELFDRRADKIHHCTTILSMSLLALVFINPADLNPVVALAVCFLLSDFGLLIGFTYLRLRLGKAY